jgi:serine phosphatase RsbU (regulator of sigma subunit)/CHASE2 domain-containing sensor protein
MGGSIPAMRRFFWNFVREHPVFCALLGIWIGLWATLVNLGINDFFDQQIESPVAFRLREALDEGLTLSPRLKIFAFDDKTAAAFGSTSLPPNIWPPLLRNLDTAQPSLIAINVGFSINRSVSEQEQSEIQSIKNLKTRIVAAGMISPNPWSLRTAMAREDFPSSWHRSGEIDHAYTIENGYLYGPEKPFRGIFSDLGHVMQPWSQSFSPLIFAGKDIAIPHLGLLGAASLSIKNRQLYVDEQALYLSQNGTIPVNFVAPKKIAGKMRSLLSLLQKIDAGHVEDLVKPHDVVVLVGAYGSGFSDNLASPFGSIPGAFYSISILNSTLQGLWLRHLDPSLLLIVALGFCGAWMGWTLSPFLFWIVAGVGIHLAFATVQLAFMKIGIMISWIIPMLTYLGAATLAFSTKRQMEGRRRIFLELERLTASSFQKDFLPPADDSHPSYTIAAFYQAAEAVGGDWYSYHLVKDRWLYLHVGDVTGHGTPAALLASYSKGAIDTLHQAVAILPDEIPPLPMIHEGLNGILRRSGTDQLLLTMISIVLDLETGDAWYLNSAHQPGVVLVLSENKARFFRASGSSILGFSDELAHLDIKHQRLSGGEYLILFTDGLLPKMKNFLKTRNLQKIIVAINNGEIKNPDELRNYFLQRLNSGKDLKPEEQDDVTLLIVKYESRASCIGSS